MTVTKDGVCCLCGCPYGEYGHNPAPLGDLETERCCDDCNAIFVLAARLRRRIDPATAPEKVVRRYLSYLYSIKKGE